MVHTVSLCTDHVTLLCNFSDVNQLIGLSINPTKTGNMAAAHSFVQEKRKHITQLKLNNKLQDNIEINAAVKFSKVGVQIHIMFSIKK